MKWFFIALAALLLFPNISFASAQPGIYISQVQITGGKNNTGNDFIEFFNANSSPINLKGYRLVKRPGSANSDTLVKSWSKDTFIPAKSFYLWANSGFVSLSAKPDAVSSATISDNSGVALRFGAANSGEIVDAVSWGKTDNGFKNVSAVNPKTNQALTRKDLYQISSAYIIAAASPHNSLTNDLAAAFEASRETDQAVNNNNDNGQTATRQPKSAPTAVADTGDALAAPAAPAQPNAGQVEGDNIIALAEPTLEPAYPSQSYVTPITKAKPVKYLILSGAAFLALLFIAKRFLFSKGK